MKQTILTQELLTTSKAAYVKPTSQVYEMEIERAILDTSGETEVKEYGYEDPWS